MNPIIRELRNEMFIQPPLEVYHKPLPAGSKAYLNGNICIVVGVTSLRFNQKNFGITQYLLEWSPIHNIGRTPIINPNIYKWYNDELEQVMPADVKVKKRSLPDA